MTLDEFLAWERDQPERYEFAHGVVTMMTGVRQLTSQSR